MIQFRKKVSLFLFVISLSSIVYSDVVKPALVEISVYADRQVSIEIRTSLEALLTGINGQFRNTVEAPNAYEYDRLRSMTSSDLLDEFEAFHSTLLSRVRLTLDGKAIPLTITDVKAAPTGYTKVPRVSVITLNGLLETDALHLQWYYPQSFGDQIVRVRQVNEAEQKYHWSSHQWIKEDRLTNPFLLTEVFAKPSFASVAKTYVKSGFLHIIPRGVDHILFILGLFFLVSKLGTLVWQVTMFTIAHSVTLGLGILDLFFVPSRIVEPLIALSITYIGIENIRLQKLSRTRLPIIFGFGLLHGLGFASVLKEFGMPDGEFVEALICFNIGVEIGQLFVLILAYFIFRFWFKNETKYRNWICVPASLFIACLGFFWFIERLELESF